MTPPDYVGIGAASGRGGGWWQRMLLAHPQIRPPKRREPLIGFGSREMTDADIAAYHRCFEAAEGTITGEWSNAYLRRPWTPALLRRAAPDARVLVMLSDPVEMYRRAFADRRHRLESGDRNVWMNTAAADCMYASQLAALWRFVDRDRVLVLQFERCRSDTAGEYRRTLRFLGVDEDVAPREQPLLSRRERAGAVLQRLRVPPRLIERAGGVPQFEPGELWPEHRDALQALLGREVRRLAEMVPELDLGLWPAFSSGLRATPGPS